MTTDEYIGKKLKEPSTASQWGGSFIETFNENKWSFYLRYVRGIEAIAPKPKALRGSAIHAAIESVYAARDETMDALQQLSYVYETLLREWLKDVDSDIVEARIEEGLIMLQDWASEIYLKDLDQYDIVGTEVAFSIPLLNGFPYVGTIDRPIRSRLTGNIELRDTKSTAFKIDTAIRNITQGDQMTGYLWAAKRVYPNDNVTHAVGEILYAYKNKINWSHKAVMTEPITRGVFELQRYEDKLVGLYADCASRIRLTPKIDPMHMAVLWPELYNEQSQFEDEYYPLKRLHPKDLLDEEVLRLNGFRISERRKQNAIDFLTEWQKYDDGILGYLAAKA